jgi:hypothetical protein
MTEHDDNELEIDLTNYDPAEPERPLSAQARQAMPWLLTADERRARIRESIRMSFQRETR